MSQGEDLNNVANKAETKSKEENNVTEKPEQVQADQLENELEPMNVEQNTTTCVNKASKAVQVDFADTIPDYVPLNKYWASLADHRRAELEEVLEENERLFNLKEILLEINKYFKQILKESNGYVTVHGDVEEEEDQDDDGIAEKKGNKSMDV